MKYYICEGNLKKYASKKCIAVAYTEREVYQILSKIDFKVTVFEEYYNYNHDIDGLEGQYITQIAYQF